MPLASRKGLEIDVICFQPFRYLQSLQFKADVEQFECPTFLAPRAGHFLSPSRGANRKRKDPARRRAMDAFVFSSTLTDTPRQNAKRRRSGKKCPAREAPNVNGSKGRQNRLIQGAAMRKLIQSTLISLDGVVDDASSWGQKYFDPAWWKSYTEALQACDALLLGRNTYEMLGDRAHAVDNAYTRQLNGIRKYVFSSTLKNADWKNSVLVRGDV